MPVSNTSSCNAIENYHEVIGRHGSHDQPYRDFFNEIISVPGEDSPALANAKKDTDHPLPSRSRNHVEL